MRIVKKVRLENLGYELSRIPGNLVNSADKALQLPKVLGLAKTFCPVQTGALRETSRVERPGATTAKLVAGNDIIDYAVHVHDGTSTQPPQPFLLQALIAERNNIAHDFLNEVVNQL